MNPVLKEIFLTQTVKDHQDKCYKLHSHTGEEQGAFLQALVRDIKPKSSLEIGLAYGISTLFILEAIEGLGNESGSHIVIDPYPDIYWNNIGLLNIKKAKYDSFVDFKKAFSEDALIQLINQNKRIQFAYIDSTKVFDVLLVDFYLINKITDIGGLIVFDDCDFPGIRKLVNFIVKNPCYKIFAVHGQDRETFKKAFIKNLASIILHHFPLRKKIFPGIDFKTDRQNKVDFSCIAFQKISDDKRNWDWNIDF